LNGRIVKFNPATLELVGEVECTDVSEVPKAVERARAAQRSWAETPLKERRDRLRELQGWVVRHQVEIARTVCEETGKPRLEAINVDVMAALSVGRFGIEEMDRLFRPTKVDLGDLDLAMRLMGRGSYLQARPIGVVGLITPWNYPFGLPYSQAVMALAAGNAAIVKPSSEAPLSAFWISKGTKECGLPRDLVQVLAGSGGTVGEALLRSGLDRVIFTGSVEKGREVMRSAAQRLTPMTLELGGKDPFIVLHDADLERAVRCAVWGSFVNAGQTCAGVKRIYVQKDIFDRFSQSMARQTSALKLGWGWEDPDVSVGPMISEVALKEVEVMVSNALQGGARVLVGGRRHPKLQGHFFEPTILVDARQDMDVVQGELFGPVVTIMPFGDEDEALQLASDCRFALNASIWTADIERGRRLAERLPGGTAVLNNSPYTFGLGETPWGGSGESGFGRTHGHLGLLDLVDMHHVHWDSGRYAQDIWWSPYDLEKREASERMVTDLFSGKGSALMKMIRLRRIMKR
jgi:acyl-CoA reductase-like NAD-dependent aldehyde dehydrogenase